MPGGLQNLEEKCKWQMSQITKTFYWIMRIKIYYILFLILLYFIYYDVNIQLNPAKIRKFYESNRKSSLETIGCSCYNLR